MDLDIWTCRNCRREVAMKLSRCPRCGFDKSGLPPAPAEGSRVQRDSRPTRAAYRISSQSPTRSDDVSPWGYVGMGLVIAFGGALVIGTTESEGGTLFGVLLATMGSLLSSIGTIALGVHLGMTAWQRSIAAVVEVSRSER